MVGLLLVGGEGGRGVTMYQLPFVESRKDIVWGEFIRTLKNLQVLPENTPLLDYASSALLKSA